MQIAVWRVRDEAGLRYDPSGKTQILVLKDRHGALREHFMRFDGERQLFLPDTPIAPPTMEVAVDDAAHVAAALGW